MCMFFLRCDDIYLNPGQTANLFSDIELFNQNNKGISDFLMSSALHKFTLIHMHP